MKTFFRGVWAFCSYLFWPQWGRNKSQKMRYIVFLLIYIISCSLSVHAEEESTVDSSAIVTNSFGDNWYV